ncbi:MAG: peroxiredoxin [Candidatus Aegiribacteria sp. MLS_C]|nr:MAG: peroxiredoxin [Candidatus Aegiribacteria sp. MLS_C]
MRKKTDHGVPAPGDSAPSFSLPDHEGRTVSLEDMPGRWLVVYFYPRDNTSGCTKEAQDFTELLPEFRRNGAEVIGISPDAVESHRKFREKHGLEHLLLSDTGRRTIRDYGAWGAKNMYGRQTEGVVRSTFLIDPEGTIVQVWRNVRVRSRSAGLETKHAAAVLQQLIESRC